MPRLLKRWYVWLGLVLLLGFAGSVALICSGRGQITQANFDRIQDGMSKSEVEAILGRPEHDAASELDAALWNSGPNWIVVTYTKEGKVDGKSMCLNSFRAVLQWYAKKGAAKVGIKWD
jgi:hypothetical protein